MNKIKKRAIEILQAHIDGTAPGGFGNIPSTLEDDSDYARIDMAAVLLLKDKKAIEERTQIGPYAYEVISELRYPTITWCKRNWFAFGIALVTTGSAIPSVIFQAIG